MAIGNICLCEKRKKSGSTLRSRKRGANRTQDKHKKVNNKDQSRSQLHRKQKQYRISV